MRQLIEKKEEVLRYSRDNRNYYGTGTNPTFGRVILKTGKMICIFISVLTVLSILHGCVTASGGITPDETAKKIFNRSELEGFGKMINFVDSIVSAKTKQTDINEAYHAYIDQLATHIFDRGIFFPLLEDTLKFQFLETIDKEAFSAIWRINTTYERGSQRAFRTTLGINLTGKYMKYLQETGESDERYAEIYEDLYMAGDFSPTIVVWLLKNHREIDFTIYKHRLWATVYLLRINEPMKIPDDINEYLEREE